jgi:hypothetical protein
MRDGRGRNSNLFNHPVCLLIQERELGDLINKRVIVDVKKQACVHLWYKDGFGCDIPPYKNVLDAIDSFPTTGTAIGITDSDGGESLYSTFGLDNLYDMILRPNKRQITKAIYESKKRKIEAHWPMVRIVEWGSRVHNKSLQFSAWVRPVEEGCRPSNRRIVV